MNTGGPIPDEVVREAAYLVGSGASEQTIINQIKIRWGLTTENARRLYNAAVKESARPLREQGTNDLLWGFGWFAVGGAITAVTYITSAPNGTYFVFWGPMIYGAYRLFKGFDRKFKYSADTRGVFVWLAVAIALGAGLVAAATLTLDAGSVDAPPESDFSWQEYDASYPGNGTMYIAGWIENLNDEWTITSVYLIVDLYDTNGALLDTQTAELTVKDIGPGQSRNYSASFDAVNTMDSYDTTIEWEWVMR